MTGAGTFRKESRTAPQGYFAWEAAGLRWLAATATVPVADVVEEGPAHLTLRRLESEPPTAAAAEAFGRALAALHRIPATYGEAPAGWSGAGWFGPLDDPLPLPLGTYDGWPALMRARWDGLADLATGRGHLPADVADGIRGLGARLEEYDPGEQAARVHGDLWSGNLMWTPHGVTLIDPAAHGGHREAELAMLMLFGCPHEQRLLAAYDEAYPLAPGWRERIALHQVHPVLLHVAVFGEGYLPMLRRLLHPWLP